MRLLLFMLLSAWSVGAAILGPDLASQAVTAFRPDIIPGLWLWLDAGWTLSGMTNNQSVPTWPDMLTPTTLWTNLTSSKQPTFKTDMANGRPCVFFDNVDDDLSYEMPATTLAECTFFLAFIPMAVGANNGRYCSFGDTTYTNEFKSIANQYGNSYWVVDSAGVARVTSTHQFHVFCLHKSTGTTFTNMLDNAPSNSGTWAVTNATLARIGATIKTSFTGKSGGWYAELLYYTNSLSSADAAAVRRYLCRKYGAVGK